MKSKTKQVIADLFFVSVGNALTAAASTFFIAANSLVTGGTTGVGLFVTHFFPNINVSAVVFACNVILFLFGLFILGRKFAVTTILGSLLFPGFMALFEFIIQDNVITEDNLLAALIAALLIGVGIGMVIRVGSSTGGFDIPPLIFKKLFNLPVSVGMWIIDGTIIILQCVIFPLENALYGIVMVVIYSYLIDKISLIGQKKTQVKIVSQKHEVIKNLLIHELDHGLTLLHGQTGYLNHETEVILSVISQRDLNVLKARVQEIDPEAFIMISVITEVRGRGFSKERIHIERKKGANACQDAKNMVQSSKEA